MSVLPVALQVYTVRDYAEKDFRGTMKKLKEIGYDYIELAGLYNYRADEIKAICDDVGIKIISAHVGLAELISDTANTVDKYLSIGCRYIAIPFLDDKQRPGAPGFANILSEIKRIGKVCHEKGAVLLYHNHDFEFIKMEDGSFGLDYMYSAVSPDYLKTELDTCWVKVAGQSPSAYIRKYAGRCPVVHLKDFKGAKTENMYELIGITKKADVTDKFGFMPVGYGVQDFPSILKAALESGAEYVVVEQDRSDDCTSLEAAAKSRAYLKSIGW